MTDYEVPGGNAGLLGFAPASGGLKATVIPADASPATAGVRVLRFVRQLVKEGSVEAVAARVKQLRVHFPKLDGNPDAADVAELRNWAADGTNPDWPMTWWTLLAKTLGNPDAILTSGHLVAAPEFALNSLLCEWGYVINFRQEVIEVYRGVQTRPPQRGRWAGKEFAEDRAVRELLARETGKDVYPINLVARLPFDRLPTDEAFLTHLDHLL